MEYQKLKSLVDVLLQGIYYILRQNPMKLFLDTADAQTIIKHFDTGLIDGITTNPTLILKSGRNPEDVYRELSGHGIPDISMEIVTEEVDVFVSEGKRLKEEFGDVTTIKVPCTPAGLKACKLLTDEGIKVLSLIHISEPTRPY